MPGKETGGISIGSRESPGHRDAESICNKQRKFSRGQGSCVCRVRGVTSSKVVTGVLGRGPLSLASFSHAFYTRSDSLCTLAPTQIWI